MSSIVSTRELLCGVYYLTVMIIVGGHDVTRYYVTAYAVT